ncbi:MAG: hypothetical protein H0X24_24820 [Ktedonobacterales bacterium]|nr:hypothetical protein [Ktedonobacterales bacterium]
MSNNTATREWSHQTRAALERLARKRAAEWETTPTNPANLIYPLLSILDRSHIPVDEVLNFCAETIARDLVGLMEEQRAATDNAS